MTLTVQQAAAHLGKTVRQVRYMIQQGSLPAKKVGGRLVVESGDLPQTEAKKAAGERKARQLRGLVDDALEVPEKLPRRYSVLDLKAFQLCLPLFRQASDELGAEHPATTQLRRALELLSQGCHRYERGDKADAYRQARDAASLAVCELVLDGTPPAAEIRSAIEQELMASLAGILRRAERRGRQR